MDVGRRDFLTRPASDQAKEMTMLLAQSDAKFKYCPFMKTQDDKLRFCLVADCMMWRFKHPEKHGEGDDGYCGLAGKPAGAM